MREGNRRDTYLAFLSLPGANAVFLGTEREEPLRGSGNVDVEYKYTIFIFQRCGHLGQQQAGAFLL